MRGKAQPNFTLYVNPDGKGFRAWSLSEQDRRFKIGGCLRRLALSKPPLRGSRPALGFRTGSNDLPGPPIAALNRETLGLVPRHPMDLRASQLNDSIENRRAAPLEAVLINLETRRRRRPSRHRRICLQLSLVLG